MQKQHIITGNYSQEIDNLKCYPAFNEHHYLYQKIKPGFLYVAELIKNRFKIGRTTEILPRLSSYSTCLLKYIGKPLQRFAIIGPFNMANDAEKEFLKILNNPDSKCKLSVSNEWFTGDFESACDAALKIKTSIYKPYFSLQQKYEIKRADRLGLPTTYYYNYSI